MGSMASCALSCLLFFSFLISPSVSFMATSTNTRLSLASRSLASASSARGAPSANRCSVGKWTMTEEEGKVKGVVHFINLSNGLESLPMLKGTPVAFTRIQSSHCEAGNFNGILGGLDPTLLLYLALGYHCYLHDYGSRNKKRMAPRAVWYGVTFIKYALHKMWELPGDPAKPILRGHNVAADFDHALRNLDKAVKKKIRYFKNFAETDQIFLFGLVGATEMDGRQDWQADLASNFAGSPGSLVQSDSDAIDQACEQGLKVFDTDVGFEWEPQQQQQAESA